MATEFDAIKSPSRFNMTPPHPIRSRDVAESLDNQAFGVGNGSHGPAEARDLISILEARMQVIELNEIDERLRP